MTSDLFLTVLALVLFLLAAVRVPSSRIDLVAAGLAALTATILF